jgi:hypothetical protein
LRDDIIRYGNFTETELQRQTGYSTAVSTDYVSPENRRAAQFAREDFRGLTGGDRQTVPGRELDRLLAADDRHPDRRVRVLGWPRPHRDILRRDDRLG